MELQDRGDENGEQEIPLASHKSVADQLLKEHTVQISRDANLTALLPYLIQHGCLSDEDVDQFPHSDSRKANNLKFKRLVQQRGLSAFNAFLQSLAHFTQDERGEGAHLELLNSLMLGVKRLNYNRKLSSASHDSRSTDPQSSVSTSYSRCPPILEDSILGGQESSEERETERDMPQPSTTQGAVSSPPKQDENEEAEQEDEAGPLTRRSGTPTMDPAITVRYFLRFAVLFTCIFSPVYLFGGVALIVLSLSAFTTRESCSEIVSAHSLTVFNLLCGFLCLTIPGLLIMLAVYYCCENRNPAWHGEYHVLSSKTLVIWTTIGFFLAFFILTFTEVLYALVYVAPQVYTSYGAWNQTQCGREVFLTSFWVLNISGTVVVFLVASLAVYLSILYFKWVTDPKKPGTLKTLILVVVAHRRSFSPQ